jgi:hypothetical protein
MKIELTPQEANACLQLMQQGLKVVIDGPNVDGAIDAYVAIRGHFVAAASAPKASPEIEEVQPQ